MSIQCEDHDYFSSRSHYQKSEAQIQTDKGLYDTSMIPRDKIERSLNHRKNNLMKNMDEYTRIMNLSKELNEKDRAIKELVKKFEKEKKNSQSVQSKLKEKEKEIKNLKKPKSLKKEVHYEEEDRVKK